MTGIVLRYTAHTASQRPIRPDVRSPYLIGIPTTCHFSTQLAPHYPDHYIFSTLSFSHYRDHYGRLVSLRRNRGVCRKLMVGRRCCRIDVFSLILASSRVF